MQHDLFSWSNMGKSAAEGRGTERAGATSVVETGRNTNEIFPPSASSGNKSLRTCKPAIIGCLKAKVLKLLHILCPSDPDGIRFRACYALSLGSMFGLPLIPSDEEYCRRFEPSGSFEPYLLPKFDIAALQAARFAEVAMGALADGERSMVLELANASVLCLQDCVEEPVHPSCMFDVARTFFFHGIFRCAILQIIFWIETKFMHSSQMNWLMISAALMLGNTSEIWKDILSTEGSVSGI